MEAPYRASARAPAVSGVAPAVLGLALALLALAVSPGSTLGQDCHDYSRHMHFVDRILNGTPVEDVIIHGSYAMTVGSGGSAPFQVVDVSNPTAAKKVAELWLDLWQHALAIEGDLVAVAAHLIDNRDGSAGYELGALQLVDVSDPFSPTFVSQLLFENRMPADVAAAGGHAYLTIGDLVVVDISDPRVPEVVGSYPLTDGSIVSTSGGYAFVVDELGDDTSVLHVLDLIDPSSPQLAGSLALDWTCRDLTVNGDLLYLACRTNQTHVGGLVVIDISSPESPEMVSVTELPAGGAWGVGVEGDIAIVQSYFLTGFDISRPEAPELRGHTRVSAGAERIIVRDGYAFLATSTHGLQIFDVREPTSASYVHSVPAPGAPEDIVVMGEHAFVVDETAGFLVLDISDPLNPVELARESIPPSATPRKLCLSGDFAYIAGGGLSVVDLSEPLDPRLRGSVPVAEPPFAYQAVTVDNHTYLGTSDGLMIFDITDPDHPLLRNTLVLDDFCSYLDDWQGHLYIGCHEFFPDYHWRLRALDLRDPINPEIVGSVELPYGIAMVKASDDVAYVSTMDFASSHLAAVDLSDPSSLAVLGMVHFPNRLHDLVLMDGFGYGAAPYFGLTVFDLSDAADPRLLSNIALPPQAAGLGYAVAALGGHICLGAGGLLYALPQCPAAAAIEDGFGDPRFPVARLMAPRPNPFNPRTSIDFTLPRREQVRITVHDLAGRQLAVLADRSFNAGVHSLIWNGTGGAGQDLPSAPYFIRLESEGAREVRKAVLLR